MNYATKEFAAIDCKIKELARNHYLYGKTMPLVFGKARGISRVLDTHYDIKVSIQYVWNVLKTMTEEPQK